MSDFDSTATDCPTWCEVCTDLGGGQALHRGAKHVREGSGWEVVWTVFQQDGKSPQADVDITTGTLGGAELTELQAAVVRISTTLFAARKG